MAYGAKDRFFLNSAVADAALGTAIAVEATAGDKFVFTAMETMEVSEFRALITVALNYDTPTAIAVVTLDHRPTYGSDTGRVELAAITLANGTAAGKILYKKFTPKKIKAGEQLVVEVKTAGTGGGSIAGDWQPIIVTSPEPESHGNCSSLVASA